MQQRAENKKQEEKPVLPFDEQIEFLCAEEQQFCSQAFYMKY